MHSTLWGIGAGTLTFASWTVWASHPDVSGRRPPESARERVMVATERLSREIRHSMGRLVPQSLELNDLGLFQYVPGGTPTWAPIVGRQLGDRVVVLVHGLDELGQVWDDLAPSLAASGHDVVRFNYPDDQAIADSASLLDAALRDMRAAGVMRVDIVGHSMGGLVARELLTSPKYYAGRSEGHIDRPRIGRLVMLATPNQGSSWASLEIVTEVRERVVKWWRSPDRDYHRLFDGTAEGRGEAGRDLLPHSAFLEALNARPNPTGVEITSIAARLADETTVFGWMPVAAMSMVPASWTGRVKQASQTIGDGVVSIDSAQLAGVSDFVEVRCNHRSIISSAPWFGSAKAVECPLPPAIPIILDRLAKPLAGDVRHS